MAYAVNGDARVHLVVHCLFTVHSGVPPIHIEDMGNTFRYADKAQ
jgi:hypothetical protein